MNNEDWYADIEQLKTELPKLHDNLFYAQNATSFYNKCINLQRNLNSLNPYEIVMEMSRIIATAKDAHTALMIPQNERLPFDCCHFHEGLFVTSTDESNMDLLNAKIIKIQNQTIDHVYEILADIIPHENMQFVFYSIPNVITCADILYGTGIISEIEKISITFQTTSGDISRKIIKAIPYTDYKPIEEKNKNLPLYLQNKDKFYWSSFDEGIYYINYNKCRDMDNFSVSEFCENVKADLVNNKSIEKVVIDFRNNAGGNSELLKPFLSWLCNNENINRQDRLYVIVGRATFSSALLNVYFLKFHSEAVFIGEPTGGKPNCYGEVKYLQLINSGLLVRYSTKYYHLIESDDILSFYPLHTDDIDYSIYFDDYKNGVDRFMSYIRTLIVNK